MIVIGRTAGFKAINAEPALSGFRLRRLLCLTKTLGYDQNSRHIFPKYPSACCKKNVSATVSRVKGRSITRVLPVASVARTTRSADVDFRQSVFAGVAGASSAPRRSSLTPRLPPPRLGVPGRVRRRLDDRETLSQLERLSSSSIFQASRQVSLFDVLPRAEGRLRQVQPDRERGSLRKQTHRLQGFSIRSTSGVPSL